MSMKQDASEILRSSKLSITENRLRILSYFLATDNALAHADIEKMSAEAIDRVTVYRTLQTFTEKGIIHSIPTADNIVFYALCRADCEAGHHHDNHVHFICDECQATYCLDKVHIPAIKLPSGFNVSKTDMIVSGVCNKCNT